jgi:aminomethyltransferase
MQRNSPYQHLFVQHGAQFVPRIGFSAPYVFTSIAAEHRATREQVGLFDVYYQCALQVAGRDAAAVLSQALDADTEAQAVGRVVYGAPCNEAGGMIDDLTCFRLADDCFWLFPTPTRFAQSMAAVAKVAQGRHATVTDLGYKSAYLSVQGPNSRPLLQQLTSTDLSTARLPYFSFTHGTLAEVPNVLISRTGYSGELGYELFYPSEYAEHMLSTLLSSGRALGVQLCGLGALRSLRIEKRYPLYGLDLDETTTPYEAGLGWTVKLQKGEFVGRAALEKQKRQGVSRRLVLIVLSADAPAPALGAAVTVRGAKIGAVTSADMGHSVGHMLAMAYVAAEAAVDGSTVSVTGPNGAALSGTICTRALYDPDGLRVKA